MVLEPEAIQTFTKGCYMRKMTVRSMEPTAAIRKRSHNDFICCTEGRGSQAAALHHGKKSF